MAGLSQLVLEQSLQVLETMANGLTLAVNFSPRQLARPGFAAGVLAVVERLRASPQRLRIEISETALIQHPQRTREALISLREAGFRVFLDDFGVGFSSLHWLAEMPIDGVKIDRSFTATMIDDARRMALLVAILRLSADLDLEVVAEGIEHHNQWQALLRMGCRIGQGGLFSSALSAEQLVKLPPLLLPPAGTTLPTAYR